MRMASKLSTLYALCFLLCLGLLAAGCATQGGREIADEAARSGFSPIRLEAHPFIFSGQIKAPASGAAELVVYIEGDGHVLDTRGRISSDPTPHAPVGWYLASLETAPAVLYLSRLGQHNTAFTGAAYQQYWTHRRFAPEIIEAMSRALSDAKERVGAQRLHLVGYSGGGAIVCLLAARREDVASLVTIAGLLDHAFWTQNRGYKPLSGSLNPIDAAPALVSLPQLHFYGTNDQRIPPILSQRFLQRALFANAQRSAVNAAHNTGWQEAWPELLLHKITPLRIAARP